MGAHQIDAQRPRAASGGRALPGGEELRLPCPRERGDARPALAIERRQQRRLVPQRAIHAHAVAPARLGEAEGADEEPAEPREPNLRAAPGLAERVEPILQELGGGEDAAGGQAVDDLVVEQRVDVAVRLGRIVGLGEVAEGEAGGGQLPEALEAVGCAPRPRARRRERPGRGNRDEEGGEDREQRPAPKARHGGYGTTVA